MNVNKSAGFTLIELLLAISLTAVVGMLSYAGLDVVGSANQAVEKQAQRIQEINLAMTVMARDFRQIQPRAIRDENGDPITAFRGNGVGENMVEFTRSGWNNPTGKNRSKLQRVSYHHRDQQLIRESWDVLDRGIDATSFSTPILAGIENISVRFLLPIPKTNEESIERSEWKDEWAPLDLPWSDNAYTPMAIEINLELEDWGLIRRLYITSPYWPRTDDFKRLDRLNNISGRTQAGSGRTQTGSGRTQAQSRNSTR